MITDIPDVASAELTPDGTLVALAEKMEATRATPNPAFVEALVTTALKTGNWRPNDEVVNARGLGLHMQEGAVTREPGNFVVPRELLPKALETSVSQRFFSALVNTLLSHAQRIHLHTPGVLESLNAQAKGGAVQNIRLGYAQRTGDAHTYFDIDTRREAGTLPEISGAVTSVSNLIRDEFRKVLATILSDQTTMETILRNVQANTKIYIDVEMKEAVARLEAIRKNAEQPEQQELFLMLMNEALRVVGISSDDVEVVLLDPQDALFRGVDGLYTPSAGKRFVRGADGDVTDELNPKFRRAKIHVPMSRYGTDQLLELDEAIQILGHEAAHHQEQAMNLDDAVTGGRDHHQIHSMLSFLNLQQLRAMKIQMEIDTANRTVKLKVLEPQDKLADLAARVEEVDSGISAQLQALEERLQAKLAAVQTPPALPNPAPEVKVAVVDTGSLARTDAAGDPLWKRIAKWMIE